MKTATIAAGLLALGSVPAMAAAPAKAAPARAATPGGSRDVRCLMLANMYAKVAAASTGKEAAGQARLFYLGRISGRLSNAQLTGAMEAEAKTIDPARAGDEMNRCAQTVQASAATVEAAGSKVRAAVVKPLPEAPVGPVVPATPSTTGR